MNQAEHKDDARPRIVTGITWPTSLLRAFDDRQRRDDLISKGLLRMMPLEYYWSIEDEARRDDSEGTAIWKSMEPVDLIDSENCQVSETRLRPRSYESETTYKLHNSIYIFCASLGDTPLSNLGHFGRHVARIVDVRRFVERVRDGIRHSPFLREGFIDCCRVTYDKTEHRCPPTGADEVRIAYSQKYARFSGEREFRVSFVASLPNRLKEIDINAGTMDDIIEAVDLKEPIIG